MKSTLTGSTVQFGARSWLTEVAIHKQEMMASRRTVTSVSCQCILVVTPEGSLKIYTDWMYRSLRARSWLTEVAIHK